MQFFIFFTDLLIFFYSGLAVKGTPKKILLKKQHGMFLDRVGILHDLALVMQDESLVSVSEIQNTLLKLTNQVKRIVIIMDCRVRSSRYVCNFYFRCNRQIFDSSNETDFEVSYLCSFFFLHFRYLLLDCQIYDIHFVPRLSSSNNKLRIKLRKIGQE